MEADRANDPVVRVDSVSKVFKIPHDRVHTLKQRVIHPLRRTRYEHMRALDDVSFEVHQGEFFGIVGRNGSGKSSLLKCIAGIYGTDAGEIWLRGRMASFIELGVGFNPELAARDNVILNAVMLGLTPSDALARYDDIIAFAELEEFVDLKLKNYSSGMQVRLAFAVMVQVDADLLLIDEVLAVGDAAFQQKCHDTLLRMREEGRTIILVTHEMSAVERFCDRAMLIERGAVVAIDEPRRVARRYNELNFATARIGDAGSAGEYRSGDGAALIADAWFADERGERVHVLNHGQRCSFHALVEVRRPIDEPLLSVSIDDEHRRRVFAAANAWVGTPSGSYLPGDRFEMSVEFDNVLDAGRYYASPLVAHDGAGAQAMDLRDGMLSVLVTGTWPKGGVVELPYEFNVTPVEASADAVVGAERSPS